MQAIDINKRLVDGYLELLKNLSPSNKKDLISKLSESMTPDNADTGVTLSSLSIDLIPEKSADAIIADLKKARNFNRETESF